MFVLLGAASVYAGAAVGAPRAAPAPSASASPSATPSAAPSRPVPAAIPTPSRLRTCSIADLAADPRLAQFSGVVLKADTGETLFDRSAATPARTGSVLKLLTAAAAVNVLGPDYRLSTRVYAGAQPGTIALVGGGDATVSRLGAGQESFYQGAPKLSDLAAQTLRAWRQQHPGEKISHLVLDSTYWDPDDNWDPTWPRTEQTIGYQPEVTALQVDGDRADPTKSTSPRSTDPIGRAGQFFLEALHAADTTGVLASDVAVTQGAADSTAVQLGEVDSQPVATLIDQMLIVSDNTIAEMLARVVSKQEGMDGSSASLQGAITQGLQAYGIPTAGITIIDGSGESANNAVAPAYVAQLLVKILHRDQNLGVLYDGLPVAGRTGSLASRFTGPNAVARGHVVAKTGWIDTAYTLAGVVDAEDGTQLTFAFYAIGDDVQDNAKIALDTLATGVYTCGDNLANT